MMRKPGRASPPQSGSTPWTAAGTLQGMTSPAKLKFTIYQGATFRKRLTWKGPLPAQTPIDLTGCAARMQVRPEVESSTVLLELTTANGGITLGGVAGTIELFVSDDASTLFTWTAGVWDLEIEFPGGDVRRLAQGSISVSPEVTRV